MSGIDDRVEQTADAYMGNPKALQQKYAQTKDIFDLIALNTINEKVSAASREMRLRAAAQGKPPTLYEKAEAQAVDNTKKEIIDKQAGVMQNKLRQQQEAQKKLMQAAGAPGGVGAMPPPSAGIASVPAPNMQGMASMAGGGIVAFDEGGNVGEEEAQRAYAARRQNQPPREAPRAEPQGGGMPAGLAALLGIRPEDVYRQRSEEVARGVNLTPEERAGKERQLRERTAFDKDSELTNFLLGMANRSSIGSAIAGGGAAAQNTRNQAMINRHRAEGELIDIGPESRKAGFKAGEAAYAPSMQGLASGVQSAANMAATGEAAASRADTARARLDEMAEKRRAETLLRVEGLVTNDPQYKSIVEAAKMAESVATMAPTPANIAKRDNLRRDQSAFYNQLFRDKLQHHMSNAGNTGSAPPTTTAPPPPVQTVPFGSLPPRP